MTQPLWAPVVPPAHDPLPEDRRVDDLVVGAGITGLTTALLLARAGRQVAVVEARGIGAGTTGRTTAKISLLQGTRLSRLLDRQPREVVAGYVDANREGRDWLVRFCDHHGVDWQQRAAATYAAAPEEVATVEAEHQAANALGLPTRLVDTIEAPVPCHRAVLLPDQAQVDPTHLLTALAEQVRAHGGTIHVGRRVVKVGRRGDAVTLDDGDRVEADRVVLATGTPIVDRALHFARLSPVRSYALALEGVTPPELMAISAGEDVRSLRDVPTPSGPVLMVGGSGHVVGRSTPTRQHLDALRAWTQDHFPGCVETHAWSAQDYSSFDEMPFVGRLMGGPYVATGYDKWGMTNAIAAARTISADILGGTAPEGAGHASRPGSLLTLATLNLGVAKELVGGHVMSVVRRRFPAAVCSHLGGPLTWNDVEESFDCRLHGSRFGPDGEVLEGPATRPLWCPGRT